MEDIIMEYIHQQHYLDSNLAAAILSQKDPSKRDRMIDELDEEETKIFLKLFLDVCLNHHYISTNQGKVSVKTCLLYTSRCV